MFVCNARITKGGSITVPLTSCLTGLDWSVLQVKIKIVSCHTADPKPFKWEVNGTVILPPLVFPGNAMSVSYIRAPESNQERLKRHLLKSF